MTTARAQRAQKQFAPGASGHASGQERSWRSLSWRIGLPYVALVLLGSLALAFLLADGVVREGRAEFLRLAQTNAAFVERSRLPTSERLARDLEAVLGMQVFFRTSRDLVGTRPELAADALADVPERTGDTVLRAGATHEWAIVAIDEEVDLLLARPAPSVWGEVFGSRSLIVLLLFWALAALLAIVVARGIVVPLRRLAERVPGVDLDAELELPAAQRGDEIGELARAFEAAIEALRRERATRVGAEKLAVLGRMTAALAHEVKNPVAAIRMQAQLMLREEDSAPARQILSESERIADLVSQWQYLTRPQPGASRSQGLGALVQAQVDALAAQCTHARVDCELEIDESLCIEGDEMRLGQAFRNVLVNAIHAMPLGGVLRVAAARDGERLQVAIEDEGRGFSEEALARHAEFFFTEREGGMGIGLSVAKEIVEAHGGTLEVTNRAGGDGARVTMRF